MVRLCVFQVAPRRTYSQTRTRPGSRPALPLASESADALASSPAMRLPFLACSFGIIAKRSLPNPRS